MRWSNMNRRRINWYCFKVVRVWAHTRTEKVIISLVASLRDEETARGIWVFMNKKLYKSVNWQSLPRGVLSPLENYELDFHLLYFTPTTLSLSISLFLLSLEMRVVTPCLLTHSINKQTTTKQWLFKAAVSVERPSPFHFPIQILSQTSHLWHPSSFYFSSYSWNSQPLLIILIDLFVSTPNYHLIIFSAKFVSQDIPLHFCLACHVMLCCEVWSGNILFKLKFQLTSLSYESFYEMGFI